MDHIREHRSVLASAEKRLLVAIAGRLPTCVTSDALTLLGLASMPVAACAFAVISRTRWAAAAFTLALAANWVGDSLDGTLARVRRQPRPRYGYYVDHVIDIAGTAMLVAGMAASGWMHAGIAAALLAAYSLVAAETFLATHAAGTFRLSFGGVGPTELRIVLAFGAWYVSAHPWVEILGRRVLLLDVSALVAIGGFVVVFAVSAIRTTQELFRAEPLPREIDERAARGVRPPLLPSVWSGSPCRSRRSRR
jgi:phosphatidylglycerophosphate synthase